MQIIHFIDDFLFTIFPQVEKGDVDRLVNILVDFYTVGPFKPVVRIVDNLIVIDIDTSTITQQENNNRKVIGLCEKGQYNEAKPLLENLIKNNPTNSEFHRIMGQILSEEGEQDEAINYLIDALRWDSKNKWALLMMGNIFGRFKNNLQVAMKYYDQVLKIDPNDHITLTNIGVNLLNQGKLEESKKYFNESIKINDNYPNSYLGLANADLIGNDLNSAFQNAIHAVKSCKNKDSVYNKSLSLAYDVAKRIVKNNVADKILKEYYHKLEFKGGVEIELVEDTKLAVAAKIEIAENYKRDKHIVKFKPSYPAVQHLIFHELVHLDLILQARESGNNQVFYSTDEHRTRFKKLIDPFIRKSSKMGLSENAIEEACTFLFNGLNLQVYNTPIDLFIEDFIYNEYPDLKPYQFLSLEALVKEGIKATTDKQITEYFPFEIISKSKIYNLVNALHFKELYGIDLIKDFKPLPTEIRKAQKMYDEYIEYKDDHKPAEEYELVSHWAEDLNMDNYFELAEEKKYHNELTNVDKLIESLEKDPLGLDSDIAYKESQTEKFQKSQKEMGLNMAVVMFMVDALQYFEGMTLDKVKEIAFEIAWLGTQGIDPNQTNYSLAHIPGKEFSGYKMLAYYYISWKLAIPEMHSQLNLPYDKEYGTAKILYGKKNFK